MILDATILLPFSCFCLVALRLPNLEIVSLTFQLRSSLLVVGKCLTFFSVVRNDLSFLPLMVQYVHAPTCLLYCIISSRIREFLYRGLETQFFMTALPTNRYKSMHASILRDTVAQF
jgi:hypothetical protein